jgi:hypothetical protein
MVVEVRWHVQGRILYSPGSVELEDIAARNAIVLEMIEQGGKPPLVHLIIDHTNRYTPEEIKNQPIRYAHYLKVDRNEVRERLLKNPLLGWVLSIAMPNIGLKTAAVVLSQKDNYRWRNFNTLEEAFEFLETVDSTLSAIPRL